MIVALAQPAPLSPLSFAATQCFDATRRIKKIRLGPKVLYYFALSTT